MTAAHTAALRAAALDDYLAQETAKGFRVETRSVNQAVIVRRHPLHFVLRWFTAAHSEQRLVVSVDQHGAVASVAAEPRRW